MEKVVYEYSKPSVLTKHNTFVENNNIYLSLAYDIAGAGIKEIVIPRIKLNLSSDFVPTICSGLMNKYHPVIYEESYIKDTRGKKYQLEEDENGYGFVSFVENGERQ